MKLQNERMRVFRKRAGWINVHMHFSFSDFYYKTLLVKIGSTKESEVRASSTLIFTIRAITYDNRSITLLYGKICNLSYYNALLRAWEYFAIKNKDEKQSYSMFKMCDLRFYVCAFITLDLIQPSSRKLRGTYHVLHATSLVFYVLLQIKLLKRRNILKLLFLSFFFWISHANIDCNIDFIPSAYPLIDSR